MKWTNFSSSSVKSREQREIISMELAWAWIFAKRSLIIMVAHSTSSQMVRISAQLSFLPYLWPSLMIKFIRNWSSKAQSYNKRMIMLNLSNKFHLEKSILNTRNQRMLLSQLTKRWIFCNRRLNLRLLAINRDYFQPNQSHRRTWVTI